jgi:regulator of protease activity HflC (stomatin/prohibitin superfamily)
MSWILGQFWIVAVLIPVFLLFYSVRVLREYERGVTFLLGRSGR